MALTKSSESNLLLIEEKDVEHLSRCNYLIFSFFAISGQTECLDAYLKKVDLNNIHAIIKEVALYNAYLGGFHETAIFLIEKYDARALNFTKVYILNDAFVNNYTQILDKLLEKILPKGIEKALFEYIVKAIAGKNDIILQQLINYSYKHQLYNIFDKKALLREAYKRNNCFAMAFLLENLNLISYQEILVQCIMDAKNTKKEEMFKVLLTRLKVYDELNKLSKIISVKDFQDLVIACITSIV